jgi:hypothetical protein
MSCRLAEVFSNGLNCISSARLQRLAGGSDDIKPASDVVAGAIFGAGILTAPMLLIVPGYSVFIVGKFCAFLYF